MKRTENKAIEAELNGRANDVSKYVAVCKHIVENPEEFVCIGYFPLKMLRFAVRAVEGCIEIGYMSPEGTYHTFDNPLEMEVKIIEDNLEETATKLAKKFNILPVIFEARQSNLRDLEIELIDKKDVEIPCPIDKIKKKGLYTLNNVLGILNDAGSARNILAKYAVTQTKDGKVKSYQVIFKEATHRYMQDATNPLYNTMYHTVDYILKSTGEKMSELGVVAHHENSESMIIGRVFEEGRVVSVTIQYRDVLALYRKSNYDLIIETEKQYLANK